MIARVWSVQRALAIAGNTFREAVRMRLFVAMVVIALAALGSSFLFSEFNFGSSELKFIMDFGFGGMTLFGSALAVIVSAQLFFGELEHRTALTLLAKPLRRSEFMVGKFLGAWLTIAGFVAMLALALVTTLWIRETQLMGRYPDAFPEGRIVSYLGVSVFAGLQVARLAVLIAITLLFSSYATSTLFAVVMGFLIWVMGQLQPVLSGSGSAADSWIVRGISIAASVLLPNLRLFDLGDRVALGEGIGLGQVGVLATYGFLYTTFYLSLAALSFRRREI